jgi:GT2 family glycosyltransferase
MVMLSIIVINVKGKDKFPMLYNSLTKSTFKNFEVIVVDIVDNRFEDERFKNIKILNDKGSAYCRNIGARNSSGKYLLFLDNDAEVKEDALEKFVAFIRENPNYIVQLKLVKEDGTIDAAGGLIDELAYPHELSRGMKESNVKQSYEVLYAKGAAIGMSKDVFERIGGFDEELFYYYDDTDFCIRAWKRGLRVIFYPSAIIIHHEHGSLSNVQAERVYRLTYFLERGRMYFFLKNFSLRFIIRYYPKLMIIFLGSIVLDIFKRRDLVAARAKIKALAWILYKIPVIIRKRIEEKKLPVVCDERCLFKAGLIKKRC